MVVDKSCGIYKITSPSGKIYIGQSINIKNRWLSYRSNPNNRQKRLERSLKKYGAENHQFDIIEYCTPDELNCSERFWQDEFDAIGKNGLNCVLVECGEKRRVAQKGVNSKSMPVIDIITGIRYKSIGDAAQQLEICKESIKRYLNGTLINKTSLRYAEDFDNGVEREIRSPKNERKVKDLVTLEIFNSVKEAALYYGINKSTLQDYLTGKYDNKTNLIFLDSTSRKKEYSDRGIKIKDITTGIIYKSISETSRKLKINICTIRYWLKEGNKNNSTLIYYTE